MRLGGVSQLLRTHARSAGHPGLRYCVQKEQSNMCVCVCIYIYIYIMHCGTLNVIVILYFFLRKFHMSL